MYNNLTVGKNIKQLCINRGIKQDILAEFLGVNQELIYEIEKGSRTLSADMLEKLEILFNTNISYINIGVFCNNELSIEEIETIYTINKIALNLEKMNRWLKENKKS